MTATNDDFWRQKDLFDPDEYDKHVVHMIGVGGIGSPTVMALTKMGINTMHFWDDDKVESHNLPNQMYKENDLGRYKVEAIIDTCEEYTSKVTLDCGVSQVNKDSILKGIVISGVDSMSARSEIWKAVKYKVGIPLYIDARMGAEQARIFTVRPTNPEDVAVYEENLYPDSEAVEEKCTAKAIIYNTFMISSLIARQVRYFLCGKAIPREIVCDLESLSLITM